MAGQPVFAEPFGMLGDSFRFDITEEHADQLLFEFKVLHHAPKVGSDQEGHLCQSCNLSVSSAKRYQKSNEGILRSQRSVKIEDD